MAESLSHRGATLWGSSYCHCSREAQLTERFYKSVRPRSQVHRYKTLYLWWLRSTIHRKNRPCRSFKDPQEVESETGAHMSSRRETPSSTHLHYHSTVFTVTTSSSQTISVSNQPPRSTLLGRLNIGRCNECDVMHWFRVCGFTL